jgi:hypothetical protein
MTRAKDKRQAKQQPTAVATKFKKVIEEATIVFIAYTDGYATAHVQGVQQ